MFYLLLFVLILFSYTLVGTLMSQFIYFYLPLIIICSINLTFFILTAMRILRAQQDLKKVTCNEESTRHRNKLNTNKDRYAFLLFIHLKYVLKIITQRSVDTHSIIRQAAWPASVRRVHSLYIKNILEIRI